MSRMNCMPTCCVYAPLLLYALPCDMSNVLKKHHSVCRRRVLPLLFCRKEFPNREAIYQSPAGPGPSFWRSRSTPPAGQFTAPRRRAPVFHLAADRGARLVPHIFISRPSPVRRCAKSPRIGALYAGAALFFNILNLLTVKFAVLPVLYFSVARPRVRRSGRGQHVPRASPTPARLLLIGWFCGALVGMLTGIAIGFSKTFSYWFSRSSACSARSPRRHGSRSC